jgi:hypothetical protein
VSITSENIVTNQFVPLKIGDALICQSSSEIKIPGTLTIGDTQYFSLNVVNNTLSFSPGSSDGTVSFESPVYTGHPFYIFDRMYPQTNACFSLNSNVLSMSVTNPTSSQPYTLLIGDTGNDMSVTFTNNDNTATVTYDPTRHGPSYTGGTFSVSNNILTDIQGDLTLSKRLIFDTGNSVDTVLTQNGWYYLGLLGIGRTCVSASLSWRARIDNDGLQRYTVSSLIFDRNVASLVIYTDSTTFQLFIKVLSAPCRLTVYEAPSQSPFDFEGNSVFPNGEFSGYTSNWGLDFDMSVSQSNARLDLNQMTVSGSASLTNAAISGTGLITGSLDVNVSEFQVTSPMPTFYDSVTGDKTLSITSSQVTTFVPTLTFANQLESLAQIGVLGVASPYAGALSLSNDALDSTSQIVLSTRSTPRMCVTSTGAVEILTTTDSFESGISSLMVSGGAMFAKRVLFSQPIYTEEIRVYCPLNQGQTIFGSVTSDQNGNVSFNGSRLLNVGDPVNSTDAANKSYVESTVQGLSPKESVHAASSGSNVDISSVVTVVDGTTVLSGERVLLKDQTNPVENGVYVVQLAAPMTRSTDMAVGQTASADYFFVGGGTVNASTGWVCASRPGVDIVGVNQLLFTQFSGAGQIFAGSGLSKAGNVLSVTIDSQSLELAGNAIRLSAWNAGTGLRGGSSAPLSVSSITHLSALGTITTGVWNASVINVSSGGTGSSSFTSGGIVYSNGTSLTQGNLHFDAVGVKFGINTLTPTSGLTIVDRDIQITQSIGTSNTCVLLTSQLTNTTYSIRNDSTTNLVIAGGVGANKQSLTDLLTLNSNGNLSASGFSAQVLTLSDWRFQQGTIDSLSTGPMTMNLFSKDNSGTTLKLFGAKGRINNTTNSEFLTLGYTGSEYTLTTAATGTGQIQNLTLSGGTTSIQLTLNGMIVTGSIATTGMSVGGDTSVSGNIIVNGGCTIDGMTNLAGGTTTSTVTVGPVTLSGDAGTGGTGGASLVVNNNVNIVTGGLVLQTGSILKTGSEFTIMSPDAPLLLSADDIQLSGNATVRGSFIISDSIQTLSTQDSTNALTGALTVAGGVGISGSVVIGKKLTSTNVSVTGACVLSQAGSSDATTLQHTTTSQFNVSSGQTTTLNIHTGNSGGPQSLNQEKIVIGFQDSSTHVIKSAATGTGVRRDLVLGETLALKSNGTIVMSGPLTVSDSANIQTVNVSQSLFAQTVTATSINLGTLTLESHSNDVTLRSNAQGQSLTYVNSAGSNVFSSRDDQVTVSSDLNIVNQTTGTNLFTFDTQTHKLDVNNGTIINISDPTNSADAATKNYVDNLIRGLTVKSSVDMMSTGNVDLNSTVTSFDGISTTPMDRVLLSFQTNPVENGIYVVNSNSTLSRSPDLASGAHTAGVFTFVERGTVHSDRGYVCIADHPNDVIDTDPINFTMFTSINFSAGLGITNAQNVLSVNVDPNSGLGFNGPSLTISPSFAGSGLLMNSGVLSTNPVLSGSYEGAVIATEYGGTGSSSYTTSGVIYSDGTVLKNGTSFVWNATSNSLGINASPMSGNSVTTGGDICVKDDSGSILFAAGSGNYNWNIHRESAIALESVRGIPSSPWTSIKFCKSGIVGIALADAGNAVYLTVNSGWFWGPTLTEFDVTWNDVSFSSDGSVMVLCGNPAQLLISKDSGTTFTPTLTQKDWTLSSLDDSGQLIMVTASDDSVYISDDTGNSFNTLSLSLSGITLVHIVSNASAQFVADTAVYRSTDHSSFTLMTSVSTGAWAGIVEAKQAPTLVLFQNPGFLYVSTDTGATWSNSLTDVSRAWTSISVSPDGSMIAGAVHGSTLYLSTNYGTTWISIFNSALWTFVQVTDDGLGIFAGGSNMPIYLSTDTGSTFNAITESNVTVFNVSLIPEFNILYFLNRNGNMYRYLYTPMSNVVISSGNSGTKSNLNDFMVLTDRSQVGIGYDSTTSSMISSTLDVSGTFSVSGEAQFYSPITVTSGGTGCFQLGRGLLVGNGTFPITSLGQLSSGALPIGSSDNSGTITIESGSTLRAHLGLGIGTNVQSWNPLLDSVSSLSPATDYFVMGNGTGFSMQSSESVREMLGVGTIASSDYINNNNWVGDQLSVSNGGTGVTSFTNGGIVYCNGSVLSSCNVAWNNGLVINGTSPVVSSAALTVSSGDVSMVPSTNSASSRMIFHTSSGSPVWSMRRQDDGTGSGNASLIFSGGQVSTLTGLSDRMTLTPLGSVSISSTADSASVGTGALSVSGGLSVGKNVTIAGKLSLVNTTDASATTLASMTLAGGLGVQKSMEVGGNVAVFGQIVNINTSDALTVSTGSVVLSGGISVGGKMWNSGGVIIDPSGAVGTRSAGLTVCSNTSSWTLNTARTDSTRTVSLINNTSTGAVTLSMRNLMTSLGWDIVTEGSGSGRLIFQTIGGQSWVTIDNSTGTLSTLGSGDSTDSSPSLKVLGGVAVTKSVTAAAITVNSSTNSTVGVVVKNASTGTSAASSVTLQNNVSSSVLSFTSGSVLKLRNNGGPTTLQSSAGTGITIDTDGNVNVDSTTDETALTVSGGATITKSMTIRGNVTIEGDLTVAGNVSIPSLTLSTGDMINISSVTVLSTKLVTSNSQINLTVNVQITPTAGSLNTEFSVTLPNLSRTITSPSDIDAAFCSGYTDDIHFTVLQNTLCVGMVGTTKVRSKFQAVNNAPHNVCLFVSYSAG